jgi:hypothetical protein
VRGESHALLGNLAQRRKAHHLIATTVSQDRAGPVHEAMQPAKPRHPFSTGAQHQMIGVAKDDIRTNRADSGRLHRLDRRRRTDRHERRRADFAALHRDRARTRLAVSRGDGEGEAGFHGSAL